MEGRHQMRPGRSGMAVDREVNCCGVLTVGRCAECRHVVCSSHRAVSVQAGPVVTSALHAISGRRRSRLRLRLRGRRRSMRSGCGGRRGCEERCPSTGASGNPGEKAEHARRLRRTWRGDRYIHDPDRDLYGWFVGEYWWSVQKAGYPYGAEQVRTYVTRGGRLIGKLDDIGQETASFQPESDTPFRLIWPIYGPGPATDHLGFSTDEATARQARFWEEVLARLTEWLPNQRA